MITQQELEGIGFVPHYHNTFRKKGEFFDYYVKLQHGEVVYIKEVRNGTIIKYPCHVHNLKDFILAFEIISGAIVRHEIEEQDRKMYSGILLALLAIIALFLIYFMVTWI